MGGALFQRSAIAIPKTRTIPAVTPPTTARGTPLLRTSLGGDGTGSSSSGAGGGTYGTLSTAVRSARDPWCGAAVDAIAGIMGEAGVGEAIGLAAPRSGCVG